MTGDYTHDDLVSGLRKCGIAAGAVVFSHSNIGYFGRPVDAASADDLCRLVYNAIYEVIGATGTLAVPCFTHSFGSDKPNAVFDVERSPSLCGMFTEYVRGLPGAVRSPDPMFSIVAIGPAAGALAGEADPECFGEDSFWRKLLDRNGVICNLNFDAGSTFIHFVERRLAVPYRQDRRFRGTIVAQDTARAAEIVYFCRALDDPTAQPFFERFDALAREKGYVKTAPVGRGSIVVISASDTVRLIEETIRQEPRLLTISGRR